jgi:hypothetical protein
MQSQPDVAFFWEEINRLDGLRQAFSSGSISERSFIPDTVTTDIEAHPIFNVFTLKAFFSFC